MKRIFIKVSALLILSQSQMSYADPGLFFKLNTTGSVLNLTTTIPHHFYPNAGIKFKTPGYALTSCRQGADGFCLFSVSDTMPASLVVNGPKGMPSAILCLQGEGPLSCQNYEFSMTSGIPRFLYIADSSVQDLRRCSLDPNTGAITSCTDVPVPSFPTDVAFNPAGTFAYVTTPSNNSVYVCNVNTTTGDFSNCTVTGDAFFVNPLAVALSPAGTFAYVGESDNFITKCTVSQTTGALSNCVFNAVFFSPITGITFNSAGTEAYVGTFDLVNCPVDPVTGDFNFALCNFGDNNPNNNFINATWAALNPSDTTAYVVNQGTNSILQCSIFAPTGELFNCASTGKTSTGNFAFNNPYGIAMSSPGTTVYITNNSTQVVKCSVAANGALTGCDVTGPSFGNALGITLYS